MKLRSLLAALLLGAAVVACQPTSGGGGTESDAPASEAAPDASATPYAAPGY